VGQKLVSKSLSPKIIIAGVLLKVFTTVQCWTSHLVKLRKNPWIEINVLFICSGRQLPSARQQGVFAYPKQRATVSVGSVLK
jgi:hypothetical protein